MAVQNVLWGHREDVRCCSALIAENMKGVIWSVFLKFLLHVFIVGPALVNVPGCGVAMGDGVTL